MVGALAGLAEGEVVEVARHHQQRLRVGIEHAGDEVQIAGFRLIYDPTRPGQTQDAAGNIVTPGERVRSVVLDDGLCYSGPSTMGVSAPR